MYYKTYSAVIIFVAVAGSLSAQGKKDTTDQKQIFEFVETMPEFPGGIIEMERFVIKQLQLPNLKDSPVIGGIYTRFVINTDGSVSDIKIARSSGNKQVDDSVKR